MLHFGALEAGGTKMVCAIGNAQGEILERMSLPTREPENTMPEILAFFRERDVAAVGVGCFGPVDLDRAPAYGNIIGGALAVWALASGVIIDLAIGEKQHLYYSGHWRRCRRHHRWQALPRHDGGRSHFCTPPAG